MTTDLALKLTRRIAATPERLFDAWLDPAMLRRFMSPGEGASTLRAETDPRPGGRYEIVMRNEMGEIPHWGEYREIDRPDRLSFTWNSPHAVPDSLVTLTFRAVGDETEVTLTHDRFPSDASRDGHERGWTSILEALDRTMAAAA
jgi:uncharacterized protein YndB with AHSA1/START domain